GSRPVCPVGRSADGATLRLTPPSAALLGNPKTNRESTKERKHERTEVPASKWNPPSLFRVFVLSCFRDGIWQQSRPGRTAPCVSRDSESSFGGHKVKVQRGDVGDQQARHRHCRETGDHLHITPTLITGDGSPAILLPLSVQVAQPAVVAIVAEWAAHPR